MTAHALLQGHTDELWGLCTHPFQNRFLTCGHDRQLCLWDGEGHALAWSIDLKVEPWSLHLQGHAPCDYCGHRSFPNVPFPSVPHRQPVSTGLVVLLLKCPFFCADASNAPQCPRPPLHPATTG